MAQQTYNKLVRDRIPELLAAEGRIPMTQKLEEKDYRQALLDKLREEVAEFEESGQVEELVDILEVVYALGEMAEVDSESLDSIRQQKRWERGGFKQKVFLIETLK